VLFGTRLGGFGEGETTLARDALTALRPGILPVRRTISLVPSPSAVARTILARQTCFCGLFRSGTTASSRARSAALTSTLIPSRIPATWGRGRPMGTFRQGWSTRITREHGEPPPGTEQMAAATPAGAVPGGTVGWHDIDQRAVNQVVRRLQALS
jgi:hypothetical protein